jgi:hypothetical protein
LGLVNSMLSVFAFFAPGGMLKCIAMVDLPPV